MTQAQRDIQRKLRILNYAAEIDNISKDQKHVAILVFREKYFINGNGAMPTRAKLVLSTVNHVLKTPNSVLPQTSKKKYSIYARPTI
jgi:hypothetical protein